MLMNSTVWKVSVFGVFLVGIFPHSDWTQRDTEIFSPNAGKYKPENFKYGHFSRSVKDSFLSLISSNGSCYDADACVFSQEQKSRVSMFDIKVC